jgi:hypothetical protein
MTEQDLKQAQMHGHLEVENEKQESCLHTGWEKVDAIDETYWRCTDCMITNEVPVMSEDLASVRHLMVLPEWRRKVSKS